MAIGFNPALPPLDGSVPVLPGFVDFHAVHNPHTPIYLFPSPDPAEPTAVSFLEFAHATHRIAHTVRPRRTGVDGGVVAVIVTCDTILYHALVVSIIRAGLIPFPMSPRNSPEAIASMMEKTQCRHIVSQPALGSLMHTVQTLLPQGTNVSVDALPAFHEIFPGIGTPEATVTAPALYPPPSQHPHRTDVVLYLHSSGSTGHPKPIPQTDVTLMHWITLPVVAEARARGIRWGAMALPPFHTMGLTHQLLSPLASGCATCVFAPRAPAPAVVPTPENTIEAARQTRPNAMVSVPTFVEAWANDENIQFLATMQAVMTAGGPLSLSNGNKLVAAGVPLFSVYGATEFGTLTCLLDTTVDARNTDGKKVLKTREDWMWMQMPPQCSPRWQPMGDGASELILMTCPTHQPSVENLSNGEHGYATSDLWEPHPTKPGLWRVVGRSDDVIVLGSGEKVVPIPQEGHIGTHPMVQGALMFGRGHLQPGVLVEPKPQYDVQPGDEKALAQFRNAIWSYVEQANEKAPGFARIFKEMILVADPARPLIRAAKGTIQRKKNTQLYEKDIDELYAVVEGSKDTRGIEPPTSWQAGDVLEWLKVHAASLNSEKVPDVTVDLFEQGFDSLSATFLRNRVIGALRSSPDASVKAAAQKVQPNFIFLNPTLISLAEAVAQLIDPSTISVAKSPAESMKAMIEKYSALLPQSVGRASPKDKDLTVIVTGTTGNLGAHILKDLVEDPRVARVYALNRGSNVRDRQRSTFGSQQLPLQLIDDPKVVLLSSDLMKDDLGLEPAVLADIKRTATHIVHNAWRVDFNLALSSFEPHVAAAVRLACLAPSARFIFTSSVSVAQGYREAGGRGAVPEAALSNPACAAGHGYGESKFVAEEVLTRAAQAGMSTATLRIGQISGARDSGAWNTTEWLPSLVKSSVALGCFPALKGVVSWVPINVVSQAAVDAIMHSQPPELINVLHPRPIAWYEVLQLLNQELGLDLPLVPVVEWVRKVELKSDNASEQDLEDIPAIKLLDFFQSLAWFADGAQDVLDSDVGVEGLPIFATEKAESVCSALRDLPHLGREDARAWVRYWRDTKFIV